MLEARNNLVFAVKQIIKVSVALGWIESKGWSKEAKARAWRNHDKISQKWQPTFKKLAIKAFEKQKRDILGLLHKGYRDALERKASVDWANLIDDTLAYLQENGEEAWRELFLPAVVGIVTDQGEQWSLETGIAFNIQNLYARNWFNKYLLVFAQKVNETTRDNIAQIMARAQAEGSSIPAIQDQLDSLFERYISGTTPDDPDWQWFTDRTPAYRTELIARTETIRASAAGSMEIFRDWNVQKKEWLATMGDGRTRDTHAEANGQVVGIDEKFDIGGYPADCPGDPALPPEEAINCVIKGTEVLPAGNVLAATRRYYYGNVIDITTAQGYRLTVTPNHPILTRDGWVAAGKLNKLDYLITGILGKRMKMGNPDIGNMPIMVEEIFRTLKIVGISKRMVSAIPDFHGDGMAGYVNVVMVNRKLGNINNSGPRKHTNNLSFVFANHPGFILGIDGTGNITHFNGFKGITFGVAGNMGILGICLSLFWRHFGHLDKVSLTPVTGFDAGGNQTGMNGGPGDMKAIRQFLLRNSRKVQADQITNIDIYSFAGHVYNLQTESGFYLANGIILHNCRCSILPVLPPEIDQATGRTIE
jgi:hypothetical protein